MDKASVKELVLADHSHFGESLWRNEEVGEKRANFFITLTTAVIAGIVALATSDYAKAHVDQVCLWAIAALIGLLAIGIVTYLRIKKRNRVTDQYLATLGYLRDKFREVSDYSGECSLPLPKERERSFWHGGLSTMMSTVNSIIVAALGILVLIALTTAVSNHKLAGAIEMLDIVRWAGVGATAFALSLGLHDPSVLPSLRFLARRSRRCQSFRASAGAVITNCRGSVLAFERAGVPEGWQFPQGGIEEGEEPIDAIMREIYELESTEFEPTSCPSFSQFAWPVVSARCPGRPIGRSSV